jgi:hypothetical protein
MVSELQASAANGGSSSKGSLTPDLLMLSNIALLYDHKITPGLLIQ